MVGGGDRPPHVLWCARHGEVPDAEVGDGVDDGVVHGRQRADGPGLADTLGAQRVDPRRRLEVVDLEGRQLGGRDDGVVGEVRRSWRAVGGVVDRFLQRLGRALRHPAVDLAGRERVEEAAGVVDADEPLQRHLARVGVDLDDGDVGAERERRLGGGEVGRARQRRLEAGRQLGPRHPGRRGAGDMEPAGGGVEDDVAGRRLEVRGDELAGLGHEVPSRVGERRSCDLHGSGADGEAAGGNEVGVTVDDVDVGERGPCPVGDDHRPRRVVALPGRCRPRHDAEATVGLQRVLVACRSLSCPW